MTVETSTRDQQAETGHAGAAGVRRQRGLGPGARLGRSMTELAMAMGGILILVVAWEVIVVVFSPPAYILPGPAAVARSFGTNWSDLVHNAWPTTEEILLGFLLGLVIAVPLGTVIVMSRLVERTLYPPLVAVNSIPKIALAPLFVVWFGYGLAPRTFITFTMTFFPILVNTIAGLKGVEPDMLRLAKSMGASPLRIMCKVQIPHALPDIFSGLKIATSMAIIGAMVGEFIASTEGWGYLMLNAQGTLDTALIFAITVLLAVMATVLFFAVSMLQKLVIPWHSTTRNDQ